MLELFLKGGLMMFPLLGCSVFVLGIVLYKLITLRKPLLLNQAYIERFKQGILSQGKEATQKDYEFLDDASSPYLVALIEASSLPSDKAAQKLSAQDALLLLDLDRYMTFLQGMVGIAPMIGLLGTVLGLMRIFSGISAATGGDVTQMYAGISVALINTVSGLAIAIVAAFFYQYFTHRIATLVAKIEYQVQSLLEFCQQKS